MKANLVLSCEGLQIDGFKFCSGVENVILDLEKITNTENYFNLIKYLDGVVKLFDKPCVKSYIISNAVYKIFEMGYTGEKEMKQFAEFYQLHRRCCMVLSLRPKINI